MRLIDSIVWRAQVELKLRQLLSWSKTLAAGIDAVLELQEKSMSRISDEIQDLANIAAQTSEQVSAVKQLVAGLLDQVEASAGDEEALQAIVATGRANLEELSSVAASGTVDTPPVIVDPTEGDEDTTSEPTPAEDVSGDATTSGEDTVGG